MAQSYTTLVIARILDGLTAAATWSAGLALIGDRFDGKEMGAKFGYCMAAMAMGTVAGPLIGGVLSDAAGYRAPFFFIAAVCIAGGIGSMFLKENPAERYGSTATLKEMLAPILRNRVVMLACLVMLITTMGEGLLEPLLPLKLTDTFSLSATGIGIMFGVTMATHGLASPLIGKLSDRIGRKKLIALGLLTTAIVYPFLAVVKNLAVMYVLMGLIGITVALFAAPSLPLITDAMPTAAPGEGNLYGTAFGLTNLFWSLGYALGPLLGGAITGWAGLLTALSIYSALLVLLIFPVIKILE